MKIETRVEGREQSVFASIRRYARPRQARERCGICDAGLAAEHAHLIETAVGRLTCACEPCAILFGNQDAGRYRRVPRDAWFLPEFQLSDVAWEGFSIPINLAFFVHSTPAGRVVAYYPSPGGVVQSLVSLDEWAALVAENPVLGRFEPDVECLLVNRVGETCDCYRVGIDACYKLVGLVRMNWRGMTGGTAVWNEINRFFNGLKERSSHA
ncbi:DUF5947 family protein [Paludisphaera borealis]|uniref:Uncharacterized protein n=1 Tax=Paludisphaera borealis TaxID=1387353 RepID=A0A1U7CVI6_9BACT|nr:DUF5947 family protein [Paludisphaera borealis]APW62960.1 hypothetical protein BSF38_04516 [Paludisphaera borealis]